MQQCVFCFTLYLNIVDTALLGTLDQGKESQGKYLATTDRLGQTEKGDLPFFG